MSLVYALIAAYLAGHPVPRVVHHADPVVECDDEDEERQDETDDDCGE